MIAVGDREGRDVRERSGHQNAETCNAQDAPDERGREARRPERAVQGEEVGDPQDEDHQVEAVLDGARRPDVREPRARLLGLVKISSHEGDHDNEEVVDEAWFFEQRW
jgi:hypothetical protein